MLISANGEIEKVEMEDKFVLSNNCSVCRVVVIYVRLLRVGLQPTPQQKVDHQLGRFAHTKGLSYAKDIST